MEGGRGRSAGQRWRQLLSESAQRFLGHHRSPPALALALSLAATVPLFLHTAILCDPLSRPRRTPLVRSRRHRSALPPISRRAPRSSPRVLFPTPLILSSSLAIPLMWSWLSNSVGRGGAAKAEAKQQHRAQSGGGDGDGGNAAANSAALTSRSPDASNATTIGGAAAASAAASSSTALVASSAPSTAAGSSASSSAGVVTDGFWGHTSNDFTVDHDPALDDMLSFYAFSHRRHSDYTGAVCFKLQYPDGVCVRTVQVLPLDEQKMREEEAAEDEAQDQLDSTAAHAVAVRRPARVRYYRRPIAAPAAASANPTSASPLTALVPLSQNLVPACMPASLAASAPNVNRASASSALVPLSQGMIPAANANPAPSASATALVPFSQHLVPACMPPACVSLTISARPHAVAASPSPALALPRSSRVKIYRGDVPAGVSLSATLSCPRSVFFSVYMGELDPIKVRRSPMFASDLASALFVLRSSFARVLTVHLFWLLLCWVGGCSGRAQWSSSLLRFPILCSQAVRRLFRPARREMEGVLRPASSGGTGEAPDSSEAIAGCRTICSGGGRASKTRCHRRCRAAYRSNPDALLPALAARMEDWTGASDVATQTSKAVPDTGQQNSCISSGCFD